MSKTSKVALIFIAIAVLLVGYIVGSTLYDDSQKDRRQAENETSGKLVKSDEVKLADLKIIIQPTRTFGQESQEVAYSHNLGYSPEVKAWFGKDDARIRLPYRKSVEGPFSGDFLTSNTQTIEARADKERIYFTHNVEYRAPYGNSLLVNGPVVKFELYRN